MKLNKSILQPISYAVMCIVAIFLLDEDYYNEVIKHPSNASAVSTGGKGFFIILYKIDKLVGLTGIYVFFILLSLMFLYVAYTKNEKLKR